MWLENTSISKVDVFTEKLKGCTNEDFNLHFIDITLGVQKMSSILCEGRKEFSNKLYVVWFWNPRSGLKFPCMYIVPTLYTKA